MSTRSTKFTSNGPSTVCSLISDKSFLLTHCHQIYIRTEISRPGFLDESFFALRKYFDV